VGVLWSGTKGASRQALAVYLQLAPVIERVVTSARPAEVRAHLANRLGMIAWNADEAEPSLVWSARAMEIQEELDYRFNAALALERLERLEEAALLLDGRVTGESSDPEHLALAITVFERTGRDDQAQRLLARLSDLESAIREDGEAIDDD
jgi:hypothetical protein